MASGMYHLIVNSMCKETLVTMLSYWKVLALEIKYHSDSKLNGYGIWASTTLCKLVSYNLGHFKWKIKTSPPPNSKMGKIARFGFRANPSLNRGEGGGGGVVISLFILSKILVSEIHTKCAINMNKRLTMTSLVPRFCCDRSKFQLS